MNTENKTLQQNRDKLLDGLKETELNEAIEAIKEADWQVRREVALALGNWNDENIVLPVLNHLAHNDSEWRVREAVATVLAEFGGPEARKLLEKMVKADPYPSVAEKALKGLTDLAIASFPELQKRGVEELGVVPMGPRPSDSGAEAFLLYLDEQSLYHTDSSVRHVADEMLAELK